MSDNRNSLVLALVLSIPVFLFAKLVWAFICGAYSEIRAIKEKTNADTDADSENDQRSERVDTYRDDETD